MWLAGMSGLASGPVVVTLLEIYKIALLHYKAQEDVGFQNPSGSEVSEVDALLRWFVLHVWNH